MDKESKKNTKKGKEAPQVLRCINIDCIFNSSNRFEGVRNTCEHPKVAVESRFADITIAICSEFRSKKDYSFEQPATLIELKTGEKTEIVSTPEIGVTPVEKVTTKDLEQSVNKEPEQIIIPVVKPQIIETKAEQPVEELTIAEKYNLSDNPKYDFLVLKKLYQPYTKKGFITSVIIHVAIILIMWAMIVPKEEDPNQNNLQRIVVVEDLDMPKFDPPDLDKIKEDEEKKSDDGDKTSNVRPKITPKTITPKIKRPTTQDDADTNKLIAKDTNHLKFDSTLTKRDTTKYFIPDSLRQTFSENEVGLIIAYEKSEWKLIDSRTINSNQNFTGVILGLDSTNGDYKGVTVFVNLDNPDHPTYNKVTYKNIFAMEDSLVVAYVTDQLKLSGKKVQYKYYLFTDATGKKNIQVTVEFNNEELLQKYQAKVDAIIRTIKIAPPPPKSDK